MMNKWQETYRNKKTTAQEAVRCIRTGDRVYVGTCSSFAYELLDALYERRDELEDIEIQLSNGRLSSRIFETDADESYPFHLSSYFMGLNEREAMKHNIPLKYTSFHLSQLDCWCKEIAKPDVCFFEVSAPDETGRMSYGPSGACLHKYLKECARDVILEVNKQTPYIVGEGALIDVSEVTALIETDNEVPTIISGESDDISNIISKHILEHIPDGATIQLGIGNLSTAVGFGLMEKNDLGIHSEMFNEPMMMLMKNGNVTNARKGFMDGVTVFAFAAGSTELYEYMNYNPKLYCGLFPSVNDARVIAKNKNMISVNSAMSIDVFGQVVADSMGWKQHSGVGGQIDFVKGAQWSEGGKSFIAMASSYMKNGERKSKIALNFPAGTCVTTPRSEVQYVATEYGCVNLKVLSMSDRVRAMISLAHPEFRDELTQQAKDLKLI